MSGLQKRSRSFGPRLDGTPAGAADALGRSTATHLGRTLMSPHLVGVPTKFARPSRNRPNRSRLSVEALECRSVPAATAYLATDLVSDQAGVAPVTDTNLVNGW